VSRRLIITGVAAAAIAGAVVPSFASTGTSQAPVGVKVDTSNGVAFGTSFGNQPLLGGSVDKNTGRVCAGFSYEVPQCVAIISPNSRQKLPIPGVVVHQDDNGTVVGAGDVGVYVSKDGRICPLVSTQTWQCIGGVQTG
jgi:hypothetical protein